MMASKHCRHPQSRNNRSLSARLPLQDASEARVADRWSFLEDVDAPQWADLSLEARSTEKSHFDAWFEESHEHHAISLAARNADMSWVSQCKSGAPARKGKGCQGAITKMGKKQKMQHSKVSPNGQSKPIKLSIPTKRPSHCSSSYSDTCEVEPGRSFKGHSSCSDMSNCSEVSSIELNPCMNARRGSLRQCEGSNGTPTCGRSLSSASNLSSLPSSSHSSENVNSFLTTYRNCELGIGDVTLGQLLDSSVSLSEQQDDHQLSQEPIPNPMSELLRLTKEDFIKRPDRSKMRSGSDWLKVGKVDTITYCKKKSKNLNFRSVGLQQASKERSKGDFQSGRQILVDSRGSQAELLPRRQLSVGKENIPLLKNQTAPNSLQVNGKFPSLKVKAPLGNACFETANAKDDAGRKTLNDRWRLPESSKIVIGGQAATFEGRIPHSIKRGTFDLQRKNAGIKHVSAVTSCTGDNTRECEKTLAALVAQHNQKIWIHAQQGYSKWLR